jgi:D-alanyl-D-alanine carboxypeptidase
VKTGFTDAAGYMLVVHHVDDATGGELIVVTFASTSEQTRARDATALLDWARPLRQRVLVVEGGTPLGTVPVQRSNERVNLFACEDLAASVRVGQRITQEVVVPRSVTPPIAEGDEIGELRVRAGAPVAQDGDGLSDDGVELDEAAVPVCAGSDVAKLGGWDRFVDRARDWRGAWQAGIDEVEGTWSSLRERAA